MEELAIMYLISRLDILHFTAALLLVISGTILIIGSISSSYDFGFNYEKESHRLLLKYILIVMAISFFILLFVPTEREAYQFYTNTYIPKSIEKSGGN